jgi:hypothetical protein
VPDPRDYLWVHDALQEAACLTVVAGASRQELLVAFGADMSTVVDGDDIYGGGERYPASVAVQEVPGGVVAVELNGFQGTLPEVLSRASVLGPAASIFWNVNDGNAFACARAGRMVARVDMYDADDPVDVELPADLMALFVLATDGGVSMWAVGLAMVEAFTDVAVSEGAVGSAGPFHPIPGA